MIFGKNGSVENEIGPSANLGIYYNYVRPVLPLVLRYTLRRYIARRKLKNGAGESWPIMESAAQNKPLNWVGWPNGKKFGLVLTHDIEGQKGIDNTLNVAALESNYNLVSSFNFIPQGLGENFGLPDEIVMRQLRDRGFEIGVHDLHHNGTLFRSKKDFEEGARIINEYISKWGASGFRSGQMFQRLDWIVDNLDVKYDLSTYDTDPFEPQQDPQNTLWPFVLNSTDGKRRIIEIPYTLPQDSTLFFVLGKKDIEVWKRKFDWIVANGGMALLNTHPDYFGFGKTHKSFARNEFNPQLYKGFLEYVTTKYEGQFWTGLPRNLADYVLKNNVGTISRYSQRTR